MKLLFGVWGERAVTAKRMGMPGRSVVTESGMEAILLWEVDEDDVCGGSLVFGGVVTGCESVDDWDPAVLEEEGEVDGGSWLVFGGVVTGGGEVLVDSLSVLWEDDTEGVGDVEVTDDGSWEAVDTSVELDGDTTVVGTGFDDEVLVVSVLLGVVTGGLVAVVAVEPATS